MASNASSGAGVLAIATSPNTRAVEARGSLTVTGTKNFAQPHPGDPSKEVHFICLEGNESGTYFRGSGRLVGGRYVIEVPEEFRLVTNPEGITIQLTPRGPASMFYLSKSLDRIEVGGTDDVEFDYFVNGIRRGFQDAQIVAENQSFIPRFRGVPYGTQYPQELRQILVDSGILNADFTPNEATAVRLGWTLIEPSEDPSMARYLGLEYKPRATNR
jgi:hypothetical protein